MHLAFSAAGTPDMFGAFKIPLPWPVLVRRTVASFFDHDGLNLAAELAFYFLLAIFPTLLFLTALASFFSLLPAAEHVVTTLSSVAPHAVVVIVVQQILRMSEARHGGLLTIGLLGALWSGSSAVASTMAVLNVLYELHETRPWWRVQLMAAGLTVAFGVLFLLASAIVIGGPAVAGRLERYAALGPVFHMSWALLEWPAVFLMVATAVGLLFHFGPDADQVWDWLTPGAAMAAGTWLIASVALRALWAALLTNYTATYGTIGGFIALMLWLYVSAMAILLGAEMNAAIEQASPHAGHHEGGRRVIGRLARERHARLHGHHHGRALPPPALHSPMARHIRRRFSRPE